MQYDNTLSHLVYFKELFKTIKKDCHCFIYLNNVVILFSSDRVVLNVEKELSELNIFFKQNKIFAGVSSGFQNLNDLKIHFKEALNALNYGMCIESDRNIFSYEIFRIEVFLNSQIEELNLTDLCHPIAFKIQEYDKQYKTVFLKTIYSYFMSGMNVEFAAKRLNIPKEEFASLLNNIANIFEIDLNDGNLICAIFRSIKLLKCFSEKF